MSKYKLNSKEQSQIREQRKLENEIQKKKAKKRYLIQSIKDNASFVLICIGIGAFIIADIVFIYSDEKKLKERKVPVEDYDLAEMNDIFTEADEAQYTCYSNYWDCPFSIIIDGKGLGTMTIPILGEINITNKEEEQLCTRKKVEIELPDYRGLTYELYNQEELTGYFMENLFNGYFYDTDQKLTVYYDYPDWKEDPNGLNIYAADGSPLVRLECDPSILTITFKKLTDKMELTPEQQMCVLSYYNLHRRDYFPDEYSVYGDDYWFYMND